MREWNILLSQFSPFSPSSSLYSEDFPINAKRKLILTCWVNRCYCGDAMINQATTAAETDCNTACGGNSAEICGGGNRMSIYSNQTTLVVTPIPHVQVADLPGSWNYSGCLMLVSPFFCIFLVLPVQFCSKMVGISRVWGGSGETKPLPLASGWYNSPMWWRLFVVGGPSVAFKPRCGMNRTVI